jgi:DNA polymerase II large subunit
VSSKLSISEVLADLEAQIAHLEKQEVLHAQQEVFHREQRTVCASDLAKIRERYEGFKAAAAAVGEVVQKKPASARKTAEDDGEKISVSELVTRAVRSKPEGERFSASSLAKELNQRFPKTLRRRVDSRAVSGTLRRLAAKGRIRVVEEGRAFHEAVYTRK